MIISIIAGIGIFLVILVIIGIIHFKIWKANLIAKLEKGSKIIQLPQGPVEYAKRGSGPVLLISPEYPRP